MKPTVHWFLGLILIVLPYPVRAEDASDWQFMAAPYAWAFGLEGDIGIANRSFAVDDSFLDTLDKSDSIAALQGHFEVQHGRFGAFLDGVYADIKLTPEKSASRQFLNADIQADVEEKILLIESAVFYRVLDGQPLWAGSDGTGGITLDGDLLLGARYTHLDLKLDADLNANQSSLKRDFDGTRDWVDPFLGARLDLRLTESIDLTLRGDVGGVVTGSDFTWNTQAMLGYRFTLLGAAAEAWGGYRALAQDYDENSNNRDFSWDVIVHGPVVGMSLRW